MNYKVLWILFVALTVYEYIVNKAFRRELHSSHSAHPPPPALTVMVHLAVRV